MFGTHSLALFAATVLVVNATPGVDFALTVTRTLQGGVRAGLAAALGIVSGCVLHALAAAFGLAALLAASATAFAVLKWAGAAYLLWLAAGMLRESARPHDAAAAATAAALAPVSVGRTFRDGLLTNALNPKIAVFFLALLPQFIDAAAPSKTLAFLFLGAWFVVQGLAFLVALVFLVAPLRRWRPHDGWRRTFQATAAGLFGLLAARLALSERP
jgi:threonine/homoserine/homoserine lactone efflux protein